MTETQWKDEVALISARLKEREALGNKILNNPSYIAFSLKLIQQQDPLLATNAAYGLDIALRKDITLLKPYLKEFLEVLDRNTIATVSRILAKSCELLTTAHTKNNSIALNKKEQQQLVTRCFDWLINDEKVAIKVFAMQSIYNLVNTEPWIKPELKAQLTLQFENSTAAFKSRASKILALL